MRITDIILKKRNGGTLGKEEIDFFINGYVSGEIPDYQISALLMAIWFNGMNPEETVALTLSMAGSGDQVDLSAIPGVKADKHSTGGVGDTTTLVVVPLVAACGGKVAKMSGRGLGHTGGTLDKLESIPGFEVNQTMERFIEIVSEIGLSIIGQTANLVPADKMLYALRDVTMTIDNLSLIAGSIMSKKIASGSDVIVLDVKTGNGAFMQDVDAAVNLAKAMVAIGNSVGRKTLALVTDMNQPLGNAVGNALEVREAIEILQGKYKKGELKAVSFALAENMLVLSGTVRTKEEAGVLLQEALDSGRALGKLGDMIEMQNGNPAVTEDLSLLPEAGKVITVKAEQQGFLSSLRTAEIGHCSMLLGAGRTKKSDPVDPAVGIWMKKREGDQVEKGEELAEFHVNDEKNVDEAISRFRKALKISDVQPEKRPLVYQAVEG